MKMEKILIGVDGGGSRLRIVVENESGDLLFCKEGGAANIRTSVKSSWEAILQGLQEGFAEIGKAFPEQQVEYHASFGLAGLEYEPALESFLEYSHPFHSLIVTSDARIACLGAHGKKSGAIIIVGTGIIGYQQEHDQITRVGGWGFPHDDEGSGAQLGMQAVRALFKAFDGRIEHSHLTLALQKKWPTPDMLLTHFHHADAKKFAHLAPLVFDAAHNQDQLALTLVERTCHAIDEISLTLVKKQLDVDQPLPLALVGGLAKPLWPFLQPEFKNRLHQPLMTPEKGALLLIK